MFRNHKINLVILLIVTAIIGWQLFRHGYMSMHDDLQTMRLYEMDRCFKDGQIPCRWAPDMGAGFGQPLFNYYSVFPYVLGQLFHQIGISFVDVVKVLFFLCLLVSGFSSYLFLSQIVVAPAALLGAVLYLITPYRAVDIFVRGAMSESWALALMPLVLWAIQYTLKRSTIKSSILLALSLGAFLITHNISTLISLLIFIPFTVIMIYVNKSKIKDLQFLFIGGLLGVGLSAFFTLPVALERGLVQTNFITADYFNFRLHYVAVKQLFISQRWGYGASQPGSDDALSFSIGIFQAISLIALPILLISNFIKEKKVHVLGILFWVIALVNIFFTHSLSVYIWDRLPFMAFIQFPWRFLGMVAICTSVVASVAADLLPKKILNALVLLVIILSVALSFRFFSFERYYPNISDKDKLTGQEFINQQKSALADYLPVASKVIPEDLAPSLPIIPEGSNVNIHYFEKRSNYFASEFDVYEESVVVTFPVVYFPGWKLYHNRTDLNFPFTHDNDLGLITVKLDKGIHNIQGFYESTNYEMIGNITTFMSFLGIIVILAISYEKNKH